MTWNLYSLDALNIPNYVVCQYLTLILGVLIITMGIIVLAFCLKGVNLVYDTSLKGFLNKLAYVLDQRHMYGYVVVLRVLSLFAIPICVWLVSDNYDQWYYFEDSTMWHSSAFGILDMIPFVLFHIALVTLSIWDKKRPPVKLKVEFKPNIEIGYHPEKAARTYPEPEDNIVQFKPTK